jgi:hypothetical protein
VNRELDPALIARVRDDALRGIMALYGRPPADLSDQDRRLWAMCTALDVHGLMTCVYATRPFDPAHPHRIDLHYLLPLGAAVAERWRVRHGEAGALVSYATEHDGDQREAKVHLTMRAVLLVQQSRYEPTTVRIGGQWVTDAEGHKARLDPGTLDHYDYLRWFVGRTLREARRLLSDYRTGGMEHDDRLVPLMDVPDPPAEHPAPLTDLLLAEDAAANRAAVDAIYEAARDDNDLALLNGLASGQSIAETAREIGMGTEAAKKRIQRLRGRLKAG